MSPRVGFVIGGVQKGGTTALATYLSACPGLRLPIGKEAHVFDRPDFDDAWDRAEIDDQYASMFADADPGALHGDATPIYILHPRLIARVVRYNPEMRWIVLLREPAERALSQYHMERARGSEGWALWPALLLERWRLRGHRDDFSDGSPLRHHGYRLRGDYATQLDALYRHAPRDRVLLLRSEDLRANPAASVAQACAFLGVPPPTGVDYAPVFEGDYTKPAHGSLAWRLLRWLMRRERRALRERYGIAFN